MHRLARIIDMLVRGMQKSINVVGRWSAFLLMVIVTIVTYEVIMRYVFVAPTVWVHETSQFMFATYLLVGGCFASLHNSHLRMDLLYNKVRPRIRAFTELFGWLLMFALAYVMIVNGWGIALRSYASQEVSISSWGPVYWPIKLAIPIFVSLLLLQEMTMLPRFIRTAITGKEPAEGAQKRTRLVDG